MRSNPLPEEFYRHFKGKLYQIKCIALHSETGESMVIYQAMYGTYKIYARPLAMFMEEVDHVKYPDVTQKYRFEKVELVDTQDISCASQGYKTSQNKQGFKTSENSQGTEASGASRGVEKSGNPQGTETSGNSQRIDALGTIKEVETLGTSIEIKASGTTKVDESCFTQKADASTATEATDPSEIPLDPKILEFLDARTYDEKLTILSSIHHRLTDDMIDIMSTATDIEVKPGSIEERYEEFKSCLVTMQHFECNRLH